MKIRTSSLNLNSLVLIKKRSVDKNTTKYTRIHMLRGTMRKYFNKYVTITTPLSLVKASGKATLIYLLIIYVLPIAR